MESKISNWWLVRHAPVLQKTLYGQLNVVADYSDERAFIWLAGQLPKEARWITSDLDRCVETATKILDVANLSDVSAISCAALREQNFGKWQGFSYAEIEQQDPDFYRDFWKDPACNQPPEGESFDDVMTRVRSVPADFQKQEHSQNNVVVAHAGSIRALTAWALDLSPNAALRLEIAPLSYTKLTLYEKNGEQSWQVSCMNRICTA